MLLKYLLMMSRKRIPRFILDIACNTLRMDQRKQINIQNSQTHIQHTKDIVNMKLQETLKKLSAEQIIADLLKERCSSKVPITNFLMAILSDLTLHALNTLSSSLHLTILFNHVINVYDIYFFNVLWEFRIRNGDKS